MLPAAGHEKTLSIPSLSPENINASPLSAMGLRCRHVTAAKSEPSSHTPLASQDTAQVPVAHSTSRAIISWLFLLQSGRFHNNKSPALEHERMRDESVLKSRARIHEVCMGQVAMRLMRPWLRGSSTGTEYLGEGDELNVNSMTPQIVTSKTK
jgi:hypothetical protein